MSNRDPQAPLLLITGAAGGMGTACARLAAGDGARLILADLNAINLENVAAQCMALGAGEVQCAVLDVTDEKAVTALLDGLPEEPALDAVIHTVGLSPQMAEWQRIIDVDLVATVALLEKLRPHLVEGAAALAISSMSAYLCPPDEAVDNLMAAPLDPAFPRKLAEVAEAQPLLQDSGMAYAWSKRALKNWVARAAAAWGAEGKRLVSLSPGLIDTDMGRLENSAMGDEMFEKMRATVALERLGTPEDIARTALFLVSPGAAYVSGCDLLVDGGFVGNAQSARQQ